MIMRQAINDALSHLQKGDNILYPTDTIWGIGCDATDSIAVEKIFNLKNRPNSKSMIIFLASINQIERYTDDVPEVVYDLFELATKPTTIILPGAKNIAPQLKAEDGSIAIRIPNDPFCQNLLQRFKKPIVSTSANISGAFTPSNFIEISEEIKNEVDHIVNWRQDDLSPSSPSSIIKIGKGNEIKIIRD